MCLMCEYHIDDCDDPECDCYIEDEEWKYD